MILADLLAAEVGGVAQDALDVLELLVIFWASEVAAHQWLARRRKR